MAVDLSTPYINPIIQSMIAARNQQLDRDKLAQQAQQFKEDKELRQHLADLSETAEQHRHEHEMGTLDVSKALAQAQLQMNNLNRLKASRDLIFSGVQPHVVAGALNLVPGAEGQQGQPPQISESDLPTQTDLQNNEIAQLKARAGATTQGQLEAAEPFKISDEERQKSTKMDLMNAENDFKERMQNNEQGFKERMTNKELASKEGLAKLERGTQMAIANMTNATHLKVANMQYVPSPENLQSMILAGATGQAKLNFANPQERAALGALTANGGREVDPKEAQALKEGQQLIPLFDKLDKFADKLPDSRVSAFLKGKGQEAANAVGYPTETANEMSQIVSQALNVGRAVEGMTGGRVPVKQLELDLNALTSPGITKSDAKSKLQNLRDLYTTKQENVVMGGMQDWQKDLIKKTYGLKDVSKPAAPAAKKPGLPEVKSQADFDALPKGAQYLEDGNVFKKPE